MSDSNSVVETVRRKYGAVAASDLGNEHAGIQAVAEAFGYSAEELASLPAEANMGLSCGNPTATARLRPGEVVVDLGCGGGLDVMLAARQVGPTGKAIGIDMTPEMLARARQGAEKAGLTNVEFLLGQIDQLPLAAASVDCLISNCVINLAPDKPAVFREMLRVLKPGGRVAVSDIALKQSLPAELKESMEAFVGCIAGALPIEEYIRLLREAGFSAVEVIDSGADLMTYARVENQAGCCSPAMSRTGPLALVESSEAGCCSPSEPTVHASLAEIVQRYDVNAYAASVRVFAIKGSA